MTPEELDAEMRCGRNICLVIGIVVVAFVVITTIVGG